MEFLADGLLICGSLAVAAYCAILSARVRELGRLDKGMGAAIAGLSARVDDMRRTLGAAQEASGASVDELARMTARAEQAAGRLELLLATLHDSRTGEARPVAAPVPAPEPQRDPRETLSRSLQDVYKAMKS
ncbi:hypothetical protein [Pontivivens ytuae]|uniref:Uncharacterized protein n=1 Tax=Pontivivens ytuae TaxID=2789856 RepID=A0A7S9LQD4_9RHOB|nr:hypothetical protein [Pontivivens ytuae]QPH53186.1 hypothetical protein I0K15_15475 [Pontivivens ytuae]